MTVSKIEKSTYGLVKKTETERPTKKSFWNFWDSSVEEAKEDFSRAQRNYEEEGATPAVLDSIAGTANIGKNIIKGIQLSGDKLLEYTQNDSVDSIVYDGIGKTASGIAGTAGEAIGAVGSIFSTKEGSTKKAVNKLIDEGGKVIEGGKNFTLGVFGKGWLWGKKNSADTEVISKDTPNFLADLQDNIKNRKKPAVKPETKPETKPEVKPEVKAEVIKPELPVKKPVKDEPKKKSCSNDIEKALIDIENLKEKGKSQPAKKVEAKKPDNKPISPDDIIIKNPVNAKNSSTLTNINDALKDIKETANSSKTKHQLPVKSTKELIIDLLENAETKNKTDLILHVR